MLFEFLDANRDELVKRCRTKVADRIAPQATAGELEHGIPMFLDQLIRTLRAQQDAPRPTRVPADIRKTAEKHGNELLRVGFTVDQVVHDYGDLCQSVTELAAEQQATVTVDEYRIFNGCLDDAIADAVKEFGHQRDQRISAEGTEALNERLGALAHELRNLLNAAILAFDAIKSGSVTATGATGAVLDRSLCGLRDIIDRSLAEVRLSAGLQVHRETISLSRFLQELQVAASLEARAKGVAFKILLEDEKLVVDADRQMLGSAVSNLLQNAFKFSHTGGQVTLSARAAAGRVLVEVEDECGGLPSGMAEDLFRPFEQRSADRTGVGLGLSISRRAIEANGGVLRVRDLPGKGCVFTIDLPR